MTNRRSFLVTGGVAAAALAGSSLLPALAQDAAAPAAAPAPAAPASIPPNAPGAERDMARLMAVKGTPDFAIGPADAKVVVIEYASPTCPHCALFHETVFPAFREKYVDSGKVRFILRPFVRNALDAVVFLLAEAAGPDRFLDVIDSFFKTQDQWVQAPRVKDAMMEKAVQLGFTKESFEQTLTNQASVDRMNQTREQAIDEFKLEGTPTFYINGKQLTGEQTLEALSAVIDPLLA